MILVVIASDHLIAEDSESQKCVILFYVRV